LHRTARTIGIPKPLLFAADVPVVVKSNDPVRTIGDHEQQVEAALKQKYPNDKARGYELGQIRGAFSLSRDL